MNLNKRKNDQVHCIRKVDAELVRAIFPSGTVLVLDEMPDDPRPVRSGTRGIVAHVDDIGTVHCIFEGGRQIGLIPGVDIFHKASYE